MDVEDFDFGLGIMNDEDNAENNFITSSQVVLGSQSGIAFPIGSFNLAASISSKDANELNRDAKVFQSINSDEQIDF